MMFGVRPVFIMMILFVVATACSAIVYPYILRIAKDKNLVDNPNARKLQQHPVPVLGGIVVFFGLSVSLCAFSIFVHNVNLFPALCAMTVMLYLGTIDDMLDIRAGVKFLIEIIICLIVVYGTHSLMMNFQGLFGVEKMPVWIAIPLTVIGMVGITNSINLIDGVDGLSSGMCIFILSCFALFLFVTHEFSYCGLAVVTVGALIPFFIHNVFGKTSKMYIGDGGALMVGMVIATVIINILKGRGLPFEGNIDDFEKMNLVTMCIAVMSIPVFDTMRVMISRIVKGVGPFHPDRNHLHHKLLDMGFSAIQTTLFEIMLDFVVVFVWFFSCILGAGPNLQFAIVCGLSVIVTCGLPVICDRRKAKNENK